MSSACNFHQNIMIFSPGNMWIQIIKHFNWQLFTITDKGIPGPGNNQIAKSFRGFAPGPHMGGLQCLHNPQLQNHIFRYVKDAPKCPKLTATEACPQFLDYPLPCLQSVAQALPRCICSSIYMAPDINADLLYHF